MRAHLDVGRIVADGVVARFRDAGAEPSSFRRLVDFGCGCGRVTRFLRRSMPDAALTGLDVDADAIAWCAANLSTLGSFRTIPHHPPTRESDGAFDAMIAISVFTHLPPEMQRAWIAEWARVVEPGGHVLFTVSHPDDRELHTHRLRLVSEDDGSFYYRIGPQEGHPDWYQVTYHSEAAAARLAASHFDVLRVDRGGIAGAQMSVVCRRRKP
jgi:cyclopropane fatty-acyl-phospholipid synthase-like methyltransferase